VRIRIAGAVTASMCAATSLIWMAGAFGQTTMPPSITLPATSPVCSEGSVGQEACIEFPPASTLNKVDVFFLLDDTGSFTGVAPEVGRLFATLVGNLETALPGIEFGFGVGRFEDYGGPGNGFSDDSTSARPFILNQPIVTAADAGTAQERNTLISDALGRTATLGDGGDGPESALEGLYQVATGLGFDGNGDGATTGIRNVQPAGSAGAQQQQDSSGDVPAFSTLVPEVLHSGSIGGGGFRPDALRLVVLATDICTVTAFDVGLGIPPEVTGTTGVTGPVADFACLDNQRFGFVADSTELGSNKVENAVVPKGGATLPTTVVALSAAGIRVLGLFSQSEGGISVFAEAAGPSDDPSVFLSALARLTGAVDTMGNPLVFDFDTSGAGTSLKDAIVAAVVAATTTSTVDVVLEASGTVPAGLDVSWAPPVVSDVPPGGTACFQVTFLGTGIPSGTFALDFKDEASGALLGSIPVSVECAPTTTTTTTMTTSTTTTTVPPRCGDGNVDAALGEQCDAGAANGAPVSCCDASCHVASARTVCRTASAACDADAICDGASPVCPANLPKGDGALCDDGDPATGTSACVANVCQGVQLALAVDPEVEAPANPNRATIPVLIELPGNAETGPTTVQLQSFLGCGDLPALGDCTTKSCRNLQQQLAGLCGAPQGAVTFATRQQAPAGLVPVTNRVSRKFKASRRGQVRVKLRLNKLGRALFARSTALPLQTQAQVQERRGSTLSALFRTLLSRR
jgi:hypothetical protein